MFDVQVCSLLKISQLPPDEGALVDSIAHFAAAAGGSPVFLDFPDQKWIDQARNRTVEIARRDVQLLVGHPHAPPLRVWFDRHTEFPACRFCQTSGGQHHRFRRLVVLLILGLGGLWKLIELFPAVCLCLILSAEQFVPQVPQRPSKIEVLDEFRRYLAPQLELYLPYLCCAFGFEGFDKGLPLFVRSDAEVVADQFPDGMLPPEPPPVRRFHHEPLPLNNW